MKSLVPAAILVLLLALPSVTLAKPIPGACSAAPIPSQTGDDLTVTAVRVPTSGKDVFFEATEPDGTVTVQPLGQTPPDHTFVVHLIPDQQGTWTFRFVGAAHKNPNTTQVFAVCSAFIYP